MMCLFNNKFCGRVLFQDLDDDKRLVPTSMYLYDIADIAYTKDCRLALNLIVDVIRIGYIAKYDNDYHVKCLVVNDDLNFTVIIRGKTFLVQSYDDFVKLNTFVMSL